MQIYSSRYDYFEILKICEIIDNFVFVINDNLCDPQFSTISENFEITETLAF